MQSILTYISHHCLLRMEKKCDICQFISSKTSTFKRHMKRHEKPKLEPVGPLKCPECDKSFEIKKYLTAHRKTHEKGIAKEKNFKCTICSYQTNKRSNLNQHMNTHQPNTLPPIKTYSCKICAYGTNNGSNLKMHMDTHRPNWLP